MKRCCPFKRQTRKAGFTLVEIMIVVVIIGLLAALAVVSFQKMSRTTRSSVIANDLRHYRDALNIHKMETGHWPTAAEIPDLVTKGAIKSFTPPPQYGQWQYEDDPAAALILTTTLEDETIMLRVATILDDGQLDSGRLTGGGQTYRYELGD